MDPDHIPDLHARRRAYAELLKAMDAGKLMSGDPKDNEARMQDLARKIAELDLLIAAEERPRARRS